MVVMGREKKRVLVAHVCRLSMLRQLHVVQLLCDVVFANYFDILLGITPNWKLRDLSLVSRRGTV